MRVFTCPDFVFNGFIVIVCRSMSSFFYLKRICACVLYIDIVCLTSVWLPLIQLSRGNVWWFDIWQKSRSLCCSKHTCAHSFFKQLCIKVFTIYLLLYLFAWKSWAQHVSLVFNPEYNLWLWQEICNSSLLGIICEFLMW